MGNCQAAEAATVVIQHPGGRVERVYWSVTASDVMAANPGHYVAVVVSSAAGARSGGGDAAAPVRHLKLLRSDDTLHIGHVYRLVSFEEVLKEVAVKKHVKLSKLLLIQQKDNDKNQERGGGDGGRRRRRRDGDLRRTSDSSSSPLPSSDTGDREQQQQDDGEENLHASALGMGSIDSGSIRIGGGASRHGQWKPALQSIAEVGI